MLLKIVFNQFFFALLTSDKYYKRFRNLEKALLINIFNSPFMKCRITLAGASLIAAFMLNTEVAQAQDVHFTQFDATPLTLNPAFTGAFNGEVRASAIYRDQWRSSLGNAAFKTYAASVDLPIIRDISVDDYLAAGIQVYNDRAGDGNLNNFSAMLSIAYHKYLGTAGRSALSVGLQGGYMSKSLDLSRLYFGDEYFNGSWSQGTSAEFANLTGGIQSFVVNGGIGYSQSIGTRSGFTIGAGVNNINQPLESIDNRNRTSDINLKMRYTGQLGAIIGVNESFSIRPAVLIQSQANTMEIVGGAEFNLKMGDDPTLPTAPGIFLGGWYRHTDAVMVTAGVEFNGFKIGVGYDMTTSKYNGANNGNGGLELMVRYIAPSPLSFAKQLLYPCGRF